MVEENPQEMSDEDAIMKIAAAMKDNAPTPDEKHNMHTFLVNAVKEDEVEHVIKLGNLRDDKELNELGIPVWTVRGSLEMARISNMIMDNEFFKDYFNKATIETVSSSLSREGFMIRQSGTTTKAVADVTKRRKTNKGWFKNTTEQSGGDPYTQGGNQ